MPPVLVIASSDRALNHATGVIGAAGWRTVPVAVADAADRLALQGSASAVWIEVDADKAPAFEELVGNTLLESRFPVIVSAPATAIDPIVAAIGNRAVELLVEPDPVERVATLSLVTAQRSGQATVHDVSAEPSAVRLRQLSDEVGRIAATLARLSSGPGSSTVELPTPASGGSDAKVSGEQVRAVIRARRLRARFFDAELFADPAWDMLLDLFQAEIAQHRVPVSSLCIAAAVPPTTALRWIKTMTDSGLFRRRADPHDGRRVFVELAPAASGAMRSYFAQVGPAALG
ncbi:hypothetical protein [Sphingomonas jaspsi]|uniref:hypothetical protein n=1 Tax=Sphingomonas jaspsi TaxID=392409 RepID=UPI00068615F2|nr:hypothetical protein [Sphingomonas jaspsi]